MQQRVQYAHLVHPLNGIHSPHLAVIHALLQLLTPRVLVHLGYNVIDAALGLFEVALPLG